MKAALALVGLMAISGCLKGEPPGLHEADDAARESLDPGFLVMDCSGEMEPTQFGPPGGGSAGYLFDATCEVPDTNASQALVLDVAADMGPGATESSRVQVCIHESSEGASTQGPGDDCVFTDGDHAQMIGDGWKGSVVRNMWEGPSIGTYVYACLTIFAEQDVPESYRALNPANQCKGPDGEIILRSE